MTAPIADDRPQVPRWVYLAEASVLPDSFPGAPVAEIRGPAARSLPHQPRRMDLLLLLAIMAAVILALSILVGTDPVRA